MRGTRVLLVILMMTAVGCGATKSQFGEERGADEEEVQTADGLTRAEIDMPGVLFIRDGHGIGSYDAFLIPEASISYQRGSRHLPAEMEVEFLASLEQSLIDAASEAEIPIVKTPGNCVLMVGMGLVNVEIERKSRSTLGRMTLVMEFRDTMSGEALLRYATPNTIENEDTDETRSQLIRQAFDDMVQKMEISSALRAAGLADDAIRPGCRGTLADRGRGMRPAVSAN